MQRLPLIAAFIDAFDLLRLFSPFARPARQRQDVGPEPRRERRPRS